MCIDKEKCCGCGACVNICPQKCISMVEDKYGFSYPQVEHSKCIKCGACKKVCIINDKDKGTLNPLKVFCGYSNNVDVQKKSASGGIFFEIAKKIISIGGWAYGASYDESFEVKHIAVNDIEGLDRLVGAKYVQSNISNIFCEIKEKLQSGNLVLFSGTPCQVVALEKFLQIEFENLITVSIICYGVPSPGVWRKYLHYIKGRYDANNIKSVNFRKIQKDGRNQCLEIITDKSTYEGNASDDLYYKGIFKKLYIRPSCFRCSLKQRGLVGDIVLGDAWGIEKTKFLKLNENGQNTIVVNSNKGQYWLNQIQGNIYYEEWSWKEIQKNNPMILDCIKGDNSKAFYEELFTTSDIVKSISDSLPKYEITKSERIRFQYPIIFKYLSKKSQGWCIADEMVGEQNTRWILYAVTEFMDIICNDIKNSNNQNVEIIALGDRNSEKYSRGYMGYNVLSFFEVVELYNNQKIEKVLVCSVFHRNEIIDDFVACGVDIDDIYTMLSFIGG